MGKPLGLVLVRQALKRNVLKGLKMGRNGVDFCMFADDTLFLCDESFFSIFTIMMILRCFELVLGLKVNFHKSKLAGICVDRYPLNTYAKTLNCNTMRLPFKYLGIEVEGNPRKKQFWELVVNKIKARLSYWKGRFLSMEGRICLLKSVFTAIPLFYLSFFKAPNSVCNSIISIQRKFLWTWGRDNMAIPWVIWEKFFKPFEESGLRIKDIRKFNSALLVKWKWRLMSDEKGNGKTSLCRK